MISRHKRAAGFTLIEVLVAAFLVGFGLVAMLKLDIFGMRKNNEVDKTATVMIFALELSERIRSNISAGASYQFSFDSENQPSQPTTSCSDSESAPVTMCSQADLIANEQYDFWQRLRNQIPTAEAQVVYDAATGGYEITVVWQESDGASESTGSVTREVRAVL